MDFPFIKQLADKFTKIYEWLMSIILAKENVDVVVVILVPMCNKLRNNIVKESAIKAGA